MGYFFSQQTTKIFYNISNNQLMVSISLKKYRSWWKIIHVHHLDLVKIHTHVAGCPDPSRLTPKTGPIFYVTCTVLTVDWTKIVTFTAIHTRHFTAFIEVYETINYVKNLGFLIFQLYYNICYTKGCLSSCIIWKKK